MFPVFEYPTLAYTSIQFEMNKNRNTIIIHYSPMLNAAGLYYKHNVSSENSVCSESWTMFNHCKEQ